MRGAGRNPPPWFDIPARRVAFLRDLRGLDDVRTGKQRKHRSGFVVTVTLHLTGVPQRQVIIQFLPRFPNVPRVYVDGPTESPHRYPDGTLCMWHPRDPLEQRWIPAAGAADLVTRIGVHLIKEEWHRQTGEWIGLEAEHSPQNRASQAEAL